ncbi:MAG: glycerophosphodiester phosphodiesterase [Alphaproteobacteria bacterium]
MEKTQKAAAPRHETDGDHRVAIGGDHRVAIGGHRGYGCTDHDFYQTRRDIAALPVENTAESVAAAFAAGADYVEIDAVMSADGVVFTLHNVVVADHFFGKTQPAAPLNTLPFKEITRFKTGRHVNGRIAPLSEIMALIARVSPKTLLWDVNIEIKGVQGANQPLETNDFIKRIAAVVKDSPVPAARVLFSSFALQNIIAMSRELPAAQYGMLFGDKPDARPIYADRRDDMTCQYLPYNAAALTAVMAAWQDSAAKGAVLGYAHPEFASLSPDTIMLAEGRGLGINSWALFEEMTPQRHGAYLQLAEACEAEGVPFSVITDYIDSFR